MSRFRVFGQELHLRETLMAAQVVAEVQEDAWHPAVCSGLPQQSEASRVRLADKLIQRLCAGGDDPVPLARLLSRLADAQACRELVYLAACRTEELVGAIARDLLYPVLVEAGTPRGVRADVFAIRNTGQLMQLEPAVTLEFAISYAAERWQFERGRTVALALRVMRQAGLIHSSLPRRVGRRTLTYALAPHGITPAALAWALRAYGGGRPAPADGLERAAFVQELLVPPSAAIACVREAERAGLLRCTAVAGRRTVAALPYDELEERLVALEHR